MKKNGQKSFKNFLLINLLTPLLSLNSCDSGRINSLGIIPGGEQKNTALIVVPGSNKIKVFDLSDNRLITTLATDSLPAEIAVSPDRRQILVTNNNSGTISAFLRRDNQTFEKLNSFGSGLHPAGIAFNPISSINEAYVVYEGDNKIFVLDTVNKNTSPKIKATISLTGSSPGKIAVSNDGKKIFITDIKNNRIISLIKEGDKFLQSFSASFGTSNVNILLEGIIADDKNRLFIANNSGSEIIVFDGNTEKIIQTISLHDNQQVKENQVGPKNLILFKDNKTNSQKIYISGFDASVVSVIDAVSLKLIKNIPLAKNTQKDSFNPVGVDTGKNSGNTDVIYVTNTSGLSLSMIDPKTDTLIRNFSDVMSTGLQEPLGEIKTLGAVL